MRPATLIIVTAAACTASQARAQMGQGVVIPAMPFTKPTGYNLGKSGWVTASFGAKAKPPLDVLEAWLDESYRAVAPKKLAAALD